MDAPGAGLQLGHLAFFLSGIALLMLGMLMVRHIRSLRQPLDRKAAQLEVAQRRFDDALQSMAEGFALFDADERLVYCNQRYLDCFPRTAALRVPGARLADLRRAAIAAGEFKNVDPSNGDAWTAQQRALFEHGGRSESSSPTAGAWWP
jgi:PAS domain-containing protein